jgi:hypothetical protein
MKGEKGLSVVRFELNLFVELILLNTYHTQTNMFSVKGYQHRLNAAKTRSIGYKCETLWQKIS